VTTLTRPLGQPATPTWRAEAVCSGVDGDIWFPAGYLKAPDLAQAATAISICRTCPVQRACLEDALTHEAGAQANHRYGIRGGATPGERFNIYRARTRRSQSRRAA
jgi:hypothetical protein